MTGINRGGGGGGGIGRPSVISNGSLSAPKVGDVWTIVTPPGVEASDYSMMQNRGAGYVTLALTGTPAINHTVTSADIPPIGSASWPLLVRAITITLVSNPAPVTNPPSVPAAPTIGTAKVANQAIILNGTPNSNGGSTITRYRGTLDDGTVAESETLPVIFYAQPSGVARTGRLQAFNSLGWGPLSSASNAVTPASTITGLYSTVPRDITFATRATLYDTNRVSAVVKNSSTYTMQTQPKNITNSDANQPAGAWTDLPPNTENVITDIGQIYIRGKGFANSAISWSGGTVTVTSTAHGRTTGDSVRIVNAVPTGYNGPQMSITVVDANTFTYPLASDPGTATTTGSWCGIAVNGVIVKTQVNK